MLQVEDARPGPGTCRGGTGVRLQPVPGGRPPAPARTRCPPALLGRAPLWDRPGRPSGMPNTMLGRSWPHRCRRPGPASFTPWMVSACGRPHWSPSPWWAPPGARGRGEGLGRLARTSPPAPARCQDQSHTWDVRGCGPN